ncbi:MAG: SufD family Fe-S cluster assembly protein [Lactobacillales bacterium]|nr:SufD family Fe-S cluster assembly protein [Lactobacillales bacterium]
MIENLSEPIHLKVAPHETAEVFVLNFKGEVNITADLEEKSNFQIKCIYLADGENKSDIRFKVRHLKPDAESNQTIKGILTDSARVYFNGVIHIARDAQKSMGYENHRAILLSDTAATTVVPELEILADDVKCSHGSAIGPINKTELFYIQSRGIPAAEAKKMLIRSFLFEAAAPEFETYIDDWMAKHV